MKTLTVYSPAELKEVSQEGFERALERFRGMQDEIPWSEEIMDSLKATFKASGIALRDWSIDAYGYSYVSFDMETDVKGLTGNRALAWLENNLFSGLREGRKFSNRVKNYSGKWYDFTKYGEIPDCPFTGYYADDDFIESLLEDIKAGETLGEAYSNLARVAAKMFENEIKYQNSEENFLEQEHLQFTIEGRMV